MIEQNAAVLGRLIFVLTIPDGAAFSRNIRDAVAQRFVDQGSPISKQEISGILSDMYCRGYLETDNTLKLRRPPRISETGKHDMTRLTFD